MPSTESEDDQKKSNTAVSHVAMQNAAKHSPIEAIEIIMKKVWPFSSIEKNGLQISIFHKELTL